MNRFSPASRFFSPSRLVTLLFVFVILLQKPLTGGANTYNIADGDVSGLIGALESAQDGDRIELAENGTYTLTSIYPSGGPAPSGLPPVSREIKLQGNGATIQRSPEAPAFWILVTHGAGMQTRFSDLTIKGGAGGVYNLDSSPTFADCVFENNRAPDSGGGMLNENSHPNLRNCLFQNNRAFDGGGMANHYGSAPVISDSSFVDNLADFWGGGIFNEGSHAVVLDTTFINNRAWDDGAGMHNRASNPVVMGCRFENNYADEDGGGMFNSSSNPAIVATVFEANRADHGGGIRNVSSHPAIFDTVFHRNQARTDGDGGGMANSNSHPTIIACTFTENRSGDYGNGGAMTNFNSNPSIIDSRFEGNRAGERGGGGIYNQGSEPTIQNVVFRNNHAARLGGGIDNRMGSRSTVIDSVFEQNIGQGGGIRSDPTSLAAVGTSSFCQNDRDDIVGPWQDLGFNQFRRSCGQTYTAWAMEHFGESGLENDSIGGAHANPAGDGISNLMKYALGLDPLQPQPGPLLSPEVGAFPETEGKKFLSLSFSHPSGLSDPRFRVQISDELKSWSEEAVLVNINDDGATTTRTYRDIRPADEFEHRFMRLMVSSDGNEGPSIGEALGQPTWDWVTGGDSVWSGQVGNSRLGGMAARSGRIFDDETTWLETTVEGPGNLTFWWSVSSDPWGDDLVFYVGEDERGRIAGEVSWQERSFQIPSGPQTLRWVYSKDRDEASGEDAAWLDAIIWEPEP